MFTIYLLRHGAVDVENGTYYGILDYNLSELGKEEAYTAANYIKNENLDEIWCSPLTRTKETADIICKKLNKSYEINELLIEKSFGIFEGMTFEKILSNYPEESQLWLDDWYNYEMTGGESANSLHKRCIKVAKQLMNDKKNILVVSHQGVLRYLLAELLQLDKESMWRFSIKSGKLAKIIVNDEGYAYMEVL
ncbi:MAG: alpha-ribazole phosphatase [Clostridiales bacterium]|nr:alpha-ribazole phosphatase [Clostridiales bacterium]